MRTTGRNQCWYSPCPGGRHHQVWVGYITQLSYDSHGKNGRNGAISFRNANFPLVGNNYIKLEKPYQRWRCHQDSSWQAPPGRLFHTKIGRKCEARNRVLNHRNRGVCGGLWGHSTIKGCSPFEQYSSTTRTIYSTATPQTEFGVAATTLFR